MTPEEIRRLSYLKAVKLEKLIDLVEQRIDAASSELTKIILKEFLQKLTIEQGKVIAQYNRQTLTLFNQAFKKYQDKVKEKLIKSIVGDIDEIFEENDKFYKKTIRGYNLEKDTMRRLLNRRLGIREDGSLIKQGYMNGLLDDGAIRSEIQKFVFKEMFRSSGFEAFKEGLREFIEGNKDRYGAFQRYYRGFAQDAYSSMDRFIGGEYAQRLGLTHFIYQGGLIKSSRKFCIERNAKVFTTEEAEQWRDDPDLEAIDSRERYNWLIDMGGYNCRHFPDFIDQATAEYLRPELKDS